VKRWCSIFVLALLGLPAIGAEVVVATHYFYWYRWPAEHFKQPGPGPSEGHFHHFVNPEKVSYLSEDWHAGELWLMKAAGIDVALPVYWGAPGAYDRPGTRFSVDGLKPMVAAARRLGDRAPKIGLFYDTSTLLNDVRGAAPAGGKADLTTPAGRELFARTIIEFFERVPRELWGRVDGRALVVLYRSDFAARWDERLVPALRAAFAGCFPGEGVFLVADATWGEIGQDRTTEWTATITGPKLYPGVAQIGPGYNDSPVPGRTTPHREREDGNFYRYSWQKAIAHRPQLVLLETWNEMHEGTEICQTRETGLKYVELTSEWIARLRRGDDPGPPIKLKYPKPRYFQDLSWGGEARGAKRLLADFTGEVKRFGLRERALADGQIDLTRDGLVSRPRPGGQARYVYFQVADQWGFELPADEAEPMWLTLRTRESSRLYLEYDSHNEAAHMSGIYTAIEAEGGRAERREHRFRLAAPLFGNRQNGACDFRIVLTGPVVRLTGVELKAGERAAATGQ